MIGKMKDRLRAIDNQVGVCFACEGAILRNIRVILPYTIVFLESFSAELTVFSCMVLVVIRARERLAKGRVHWK